MPSGLISGFIPPAPSSNHQFATVKNIHNKHQQRHRHRLSIEKNEETSMHEKNNNSLNQGSTPQKASKRKMLRFAIPALGIYLTNTMLSNIDNAFVGRTVGTQGLAALSPATICTDQISYFFSFIPRATTSLVSRAYGATEENDGDLDAAREAASAPFTVALFCGIVLSIVYAFFTPQMLTILGVQPALKASASSYVYWRGSVAWADLSSKVALAIMLATKDSMTPLKIIAMAGVINVIGDTALCAWPLRWGCAGAAAATSFANLFVIGFMMKNLQSKRLLPKVRVPSKADVSKLLEFTGPLLAITVTRLIGFINMQKTAMSLGVQHMAAYQLTVNILMFFLIFGEPLSQLSQTNLPTLIDVNDGPSIKANIKSVLILSSFVSIIIGAAAASCVFFGSHLFTSDLVVQGLAKGTAPIMFLTVACSIFAVSIDGAMLASRDFGFMLIQGTFSMLLQFGLLKFWATSLSNIYATFAMRLGSYAAATLIRIGIGRGILGRLIRGKQQALGLVS